MRNLVLFLSFMLAINTLVDAQNFEPDVFTTSKGELKIYFIGHGTLMFDFAGKVIHVDPWSKLADYTKLPKADLILITHQHGDHYDTTAIKQIIKKNTTLILNSALHETVNKG